MPQGGVLSPLLFILYIFNIHYWLEFVNAMGYADDTGTHTSRKDVEEILHKLERDAHNILCFMASNRLVANPSKTELMMILPKRRHGDREYSVQIRNTRIKEAHKIKLLGLHIQNDLKWNTQIQSLESALSQRLGLLRRI